MGKQGKGRRLTDKERMEIIALTRQNPRIKHVELAAKYNVNESTIRKWRAQGNALKIEERYTQGVAASRDTRQRGQAVRNQQFDVELYEWTTGMLKQGRELAPARIREKARTMAALHEGMEGFKASSGWFYRFCRRYGLPCGSAGRETSASMQVNSTAMLEGHEYDTTDAMTDTPPHEPQAPVALGSANDIRHMLAPISPETEDVAHAASTDAAAIVMSLQPPPTPSNELEMHASQPVDTVPPATPSDLLLGLGESSSAISTSIVTTSTGDDDMAGESSSPSNVAPVDAVSLAPTTAPVPAMAMSSTSQAAATHVLQNFKDMLDPQTRLRLVRHMTRVPGEADMYLVMDDETRLEYVKEFIAQGAIAPPTTV